MKKGHLLQIGFLMTAMAGSSFAASPPQSDPSDLPHLQAKELHQYPSLIQISGDAVGGAKDTTFVLRCGYLFQDSKMILDPTINDLTLTNASASTYTRYQDIDGKPVISTIDKTRPPATGAAQILVQVTEPDGSIKAKSCSASLQSDTIGICATASPFIAAAQSNAAILALHKQCRDIVEQFSVQMSPMIYNEQKTQEWKAKLHQTLTIVEQ